MILASMARMIQSYGALWMQGEGTLFGVCPRIPAQQKLIQQPSGRIDLQIRMCRCNFGNCHQ